MKYDIAVELTCDVDARKKKICHFDPKLLKSHRVRCRKQQQGRFIFPAGGQIFLTTSVCEVFGRFAGPQMTKRKPVSTVMKEDSSCLSRTLLLVK